MIPHQTPHLVTFCTDNMSRSAMLCAESSRANGVGTHARFTPGYLSAWDEVRENPGVFCQPADPRRAWGWWAWKPLIISRELEWLPEGTILIYSDAGVEFINNVSHIVDRMDQDIFLFGNMYEHAHWCKRDIVEAVWPLDLDQLKADPRSDDESLTFGEWWGSRGWDRFGKQVQASVIFFRVNDYTKAFVKEWLDWCLKGARIGAALTFGYDNPQHADGSSTWSEFRYLIDDSPSVCPNHPEFKENRHDQAILTTLAYREGLRLHWWPASYNNGAFVYERGDYPDEGIPVLFNHHRKRNHEWIG